ncbi:unnamed protein product [Ixodes persulcatus]
MYNKYNLKVLACDRFRSLSRGSKESRKEAWNEKQKHRQKTDVDSCDWSLHTQMRTHKLRKAAHESHTGKCHLQLAKPQKVFEKKGRHLESFLRAGSALAKKRNPDSAVKRKMGEKTHSSGSTETAF